jgi:transcription antitermination factor NusG
MVNPLSSNPTVADNSPWWAIYTRHQHEKAVAEMLCAKGLEVFLPVYQSQRRWKDRVKMLSLPLFPCYLFVRGGLDRRTQVVVTPGVHMILSIGDHAAIIPDSEVQAIRKTLEGPFRVEPHPYLKCGDKVRVKRGSLEGLVGILVRKKNLCRLVLSVEMLERSVGVEIDASDVEPVPTPAFAGGLSAASLHRTPTLRWPPENILNLGGDRFEGLRG